MTDYLVRLTAKVSLIKYEFVFRQMSVSVSVLVDFVFRNCLLARSESGYQMIKRDIKLYYYLVHDYYHTIHFLFSLKHLRGWHEEQPSLNEFSVTPKVF